MRAVQRAVACVALLVATAGQVQGALITFDTSADLTDNFLLDVIPGDHATTWRNGYGPEGGFPGSDGGFAHFADYAFAGSLQFRNGPVFLNSFEISSQHSGGGTGVSRAVEAGLDYHLRLYDENLVPI